MSPELALNNYFGFSEFRSHQKAIIDRTLEGGNSLVIMPTGGGKSLCYQIPAICLAASPSVSGHAKSSHDNYKPVITVVLSPLIALMKDQVDSLKRRGIPATYVNSSLDKSERESRYQQIADGEYSILYVTPERFRKDQFLEVLSKRKVGLLAVDEAHCISQWGHDFRPDYTRVAQLRAMMGNPPTIALTATATGEVQADIVYQLGLKGFGESQDMCKLFHLGFARPNLHLVVEEVWGLDEKINSIESIINTFQKQKSGAGIVYFTLIRTLEEVSERLRKLGIEHVCYHGDLSRGYRRHIQDEFMAGKASVVLATNAFGMGIDKEDIRYVIHAELPNSIESYYQEIGRAGRDGEPSKCMLLYDQNDLQTQVNFLNWSNPDADFYHRTYDLIAHDIDSVRSFGIEWLREKLCNRNRSDRRLETVLGMFHRYDLIDDENDLSSVEIKAELPETLINQDERRAKLLRDQKKLYAIVEYSKSDDYRGFIEKYFAPKIVNEIH